MRFAPIIPTNGLRVLERVGIGYHFALGQELLRDKEYRRYYAALGRLGHFIIVDNGAAEWDTPPFEDIVKVANAIHASEIILPDVLENMDATVDALQHGALNLVPSRKRMIVPQGRSVAEWFACLESQLKITQYCIESIGIAKHLERNIPGGRAEILTRLQLTYPTILQNIHIHLLGVWNDPFQEISAAAAVCDIRGIDSGLPIAWAQRSRTIAPETDIPPFEDRIGLSWGAEFDLRLGASNVWNIAKYASEYR